MAAAIEKSTGARARLVEGDNGIFDVIVDGKLIYSKNQTGQFPEEAEVLALLS